MAMLFIDIDKFKQINHVISTEYVLEISKRLISKLENTSTNPPHITPMLSFGITLYPKNGNTFNELKQQADEAMY